MAEARRGDDDIAFFAASLGRTRALAVTDTAAEITDPDGALVPGRYLLHVANLSAGAVVWVATGKFEKGAAPLTVVAAAPHFPMSAATIVALELNILKEDNDRIAAIATGGGTGTLYITQISRGA
ncbi:MAG: hypothetical protein O7G84_01185 [Gammaproteobacteria bacterium]|nr:hypothetical protein [Gammaproteobacteria bacterium]